VQEPRHSLRGIHARSFDMALHPAAHGFPALLLAHQITGRECEAMAIDSRARWFPNAQRRQCAVNDFFWLAVT